MSNYRRDDKNFRAQMRQVADAHAYIGAYGKQESQYDNTLAENTGDVPRSERRSTASVVVYWTVLVAVLFGAAYHLARWVGAL